jgi:hypothetical protein
LRNKLRPKPQFKHTKETEVYIRKPSYRDIDWYYYQQVILKGLLHPFAKACKIDRLETLV